MPNAEPRTSGECSTDTIHPPIFSRLSGRSDSSELQVSRMQRKGFISKPDCVSTFLLEMLGLRRTARGFRLSEQRRQGARGDGGFFFKWLGVHIIFVDYWILERIWKVPKRPLEVRNNIKVIHRRSLVGLCRFCWRLDYVRNFGGWCVCAVWKVRASSSVRRVL